MKKTSLKHASGAQATIYHQGAHLSSWIPSKALGEQIFVAEESFYQLGKAIRGGVPICFPQFATFGPGLRHGFARIADWQLVEANKIEGKAVFALNSSDKSLALWPHAFELVFAVTINSSELEMALSVKNTSRSAFEFSGALHTYLQVSKYTEVALEGLSGVQYWDNGEPFEKSQAFESKLLQLTGELDRVYFDAPDEVVLIDQGVSKHIIKSGFTDIVVWNPGAEGAKGLSDMGDDEYLSMLCIEAAVVDKPIKVSAGDTWRGSQKISIK